MELLDVLLQIEKGEGSFVLAYSSPEGSDHVYRGGTLSSQIGLARLMYEMIECQIAEVYGANDEE